eukprot:4241530-Alexandrium_andersonii.AAC.1
MVKSLASSSKGPWLKDDGSPSPVRKAKERKGIIKDLEAKLQKAVQDRCTIQAKCTKLLAANLDLEMEKDEWRARKAIEVGKARQ